MLHTLIDWSSPLHFFFLLPTTKNRCNYTRNATGQYLHNDLVSTEFVKNNRTRASDCYLDSVFSELNTTYAKGLADTIYVSNLSTVFHYLQHTEFPGVEFNQFGMSHWQIQLYRGVHPMA